MAAIDTSGRIFVAQFTREIRKRENFGANALSPGIKTWHEAVIAFRRSLCQSRKITASCTRSAANRTASGRLLRQFFPSALALRKFWVPDLGSCQAPSAERGL
jgi:hypothetical protein